MYACLNRATAGGDIPTEDFLVLAATAGFPGADVDFPYALLHGSAALRDQFHRHNLKFGGWGPPFDWRSDAGFDESLAKLGECAKIAGELAIDTCATYLLPASDLPLHANWHFHVKRLGPVAKILADHGLRFGLEFVSPYHLRRKCRHEFVFTPLQVLELAADVGPNVGLLVDSYHLHAAGEPMSILAHIPRDKIVHVHVNDAPNVPLHEIDDDGRLLPGEGIIDLKGFFHGLKAMGYDGPVSVEVMNSALRAQPGLRAQPAADVAKRAWAGTKTTMAEAGV